MAHPPSNQRTLRGSLGTDVFDPLFGGDSQGLRHGGLIERFFPEIFEKFTSRPRPKSIPQQAFGNLSDILASGGLSDPALHQANVRGEARRGEANQQLISESFARSGLSGAGLGKTLEAAAGEGTLRRISNLESKRTEAATDRMRNDIRLFVQASLQPLLQEQGLQIQESLGQQQIDAQSEGAIIGAIADLAPLLGLAFGGPAGAAAGTAIPTLLEQGFA